MKERLMDAAMDLMWLNGYGAASVDAICEKAGAKKGSFYYFFKSKSELAAAALEADWNKKRSQMILSFHRLSHHWSGSTVISILYMKIWRSYSRDAARFLAARM